MFCFKRLVAGTILLFLSGQSATAQHWVQVPMQLPSGDSALHLASVAFATKNIGWLFTGVRVGEGKPRPPSRNRILKTTDGGISWAMQYEETKLGAPYSYDFEVLDSLHCWGLGLGIVRTTNGGAEWLPCDHPRWKYYTPTVMHFFDPDSGIMFGDYPYHTSDGGQSWSRGDTSELFISPTDMFFLDRNLGWVVSDIHNLIAGEVGYMARTTDGGRRWNHQFFITPRLKAVYLRDSTTGFAVNKITTAVYRFGSDSGYQFNRTVVVPFNGNDVGFLDGERGWIVGLGKFWNTTDGGLTWNAREMYPTTNFTQLTIIRKDTCAYAFGREDGTGKYVLLYADLRDTQTGIGERPPGDPAILTLYPNPFFSGASIGFQVSAGESVEVAICDPLGRRIRTLSAGVSHRGSGQTYWDGRNESGSPVRAGVYYCSIALRGARQVVKAVKVE